MKTKSDCTSLTTMVEWEAIFHPLKSQLIDGGFGDMLDTLSRYFDNPPSVWMDNISLVGNFEKRLSFTLSDPESLMLGPKTPWEFQDRISAILADLGYLGYIDVLRVVHTIEAD